MSIKKELNSEDFASLEVMAAEQNTTVGLLLSHLVRKEASRQDPGVMSKLILDFEGGELEMHFPSGKVEHGMISESILNGDDGVVGLLDSLKYHPLIPRGLADPYLETTNCPAVPDFDY